MSRSVRLSEQTVAAINKLGGAFDSPDDVIQQLIKDAGNGDLLDQETETENGADSNNKPTTRSANARKDHFLGQLRNHANDIEIEKLRRSAWTIQTETGSKIAWIHYHRDFEFWGGSWNVNEQLSNQGELIHVFLGPGDDQRYVVPDADLHSGQFTIYDTEDEEQWKFSSERGTPPNGKMLEDSYTSLDPILPTAT